jgi:hypothetical protein
LFEQVFAVHRVPMRWVEKLACYVELAKWMPRNWRKLYNEVILSAKHMFRPLPGVIKRPVKFVLHVAWRLVKFLYTAVRAGLALARRQAYRRS